MANTKMQRIRRKYTYADGSTGTSAKPGTQGLVLEVLGMPTEDGNGKRQYPIVHTFTVDKSKLPESVIECAVWHGLSQKLGDANAEVAKTAKAEGVTEDPETGLADLTNETLSDMWDNLLQGVWVTESEGGSRGASVTILSEAIFAVLADAGHEVTDEVKAGVMQKLQDEDYRKASKARADVDYHMKRITAERAAARAKDAKAKAKDQDAQGIDGLI
jgi:hypothetical protein